MAFPPEAPKSDLERGLRIVADNLSSEIDDLRRDLARALSSASYWETAWSDLVGKVGDLMHTAKARPKGRRFATVLELNILLTQAGPGDDR